MSIAKLTASKPDYRTSARGVLADRGLATCQWLQKGKSERVKECKSERDEALAPPISSASGNQKIEIGKWGREFPTLARNKSARMGHPALLRIHSPTSWPKPSSIPNFATAAEH